MTKDKKHHDVKCQASRKVKGETFFAFSAEIFVGVRSCSLAVESGIG